jgi:23S rRNA pseudouridine2457 synthase
MAGPHVIRFWKPYGVLTQFTDPEGRPTLANYIDLPNFYAAGRLDLDSEGLLLLTNDGQLQHRLSDPAHHHPKTYWAQVEGEPDDAALDRLRVGVWVQAAGQRYQARPCGAVKLPNPPQLPDRQPPIRQRANKPTSWLALTLTEGRKRQVRHMTAAVGHPTLRLVRAAIGVITLEGLSPGQWQSLSQAQIAQISANTRR